MSFINNGLKPKLVENKIVEKIIKAQNMAKPYDMDKIGNILFNFIKKNFLVVFIFTVIFSLLTYRYYDVQSRKRDKSDESSYNKEEDEDDKEEDEDDYDEDYDKEEDENEDKDDYPY
jgi:phosphopantothenoylcysteine synthetase/decarboxylase